ncbi:hypothetical protein [Streptomyces crystallinus]|uniref:Lipoprotein n=1 Tax=Streptomyces crystallinus TaxID=68191 RepID=A0ABN1GHX7_9ACTN
MSLRKFRLPTAAAVTALVLTGCGKIQDDLFSNLNGTPRHASSSGEAPRPGPMSPSDEKVATFKAGEVKAELEKLRQQGKTRPDDVRPALQLLATQEYVDVHALNRGTGGSTFGIWLTKTACIAGDIDANTVTAEAHGYYPQTGCVSLPHSR